MRHPKRQPPKTRHITKRRRGTKKRPHEAQEAATVAALPGGTATPGSGCGRRPSRKSDAVGRLFRAECKTVEDPDAKTIRLQRADLEKIEGEAMTTRMVPCMTFGWPGDRPYNWMAFRLADAEAMMAVVDAVRRGDMDGAVRNVERLG